MKRFLQVKAEIAYDIGPGIPCQWDVLLKAKGQAERIHIG